MRNLLVESTLLVILGLLYSPLTDLYWLNKQEKVLGIRFNEEMEKDNVITLPHVSNQWFIFKATNRFIAYHRNYIVNLDNEKGGYAEFIGRIEKITIVSLDGKRREISASSHANVISDFKKWVELGEINLEG